MTHLTDAANDFNEKTNNNRNLHSTLIYFFLFNFLLNIRQIRVEINDTGYSSALKLGPLANICDLSKLGACLK